MKRNFFQSAEDYPGENLDMDLKQVQKVYRETGKIYGQRDTMSVGMNSNVTVNLPREGKLLLGLSTYYNYRDADENPILTLEVNNGIIIKQTGIRVFDVNTLRERMYYPIMYPLSGNDEIKYSLDGVTATKVLSTNFHYI